VQARIWVVGTDRKDGRPYGHFVRISSDSILTPLSVQTRVVNLEIEGNDVLATGQLRVWTGLEESSVPTGLTGIATHD
jgi:hypothetical protein